MLHDGHLILMFHVLMKCFRSLEDPLEECKTCIFKGGMSGPIHNQFSLWGLSKSEADIAYLLIKGFTIREIAELRKTTEATVRQQTLQIYQKAQVEGRHQLSGFFISTWMGPCAKAR